LPGCLELLCVDLVQRKGTDFETPHERVSWHDWSFVQKLKQKYILHSKSKTSQNMPYILVINFIIPGGMNTVMHYKIPSKTEKYGNSQAVKMLRHFMSDDVNDEYRNDKLKLIPSVVEGGWIVKRGVGNKPAIIGRKITTTYHKGNGFYEIMIDVGSSKVAGAIMGLVKGYTASLVIDLAFVLESHTDAELPEQILGSTRFYRPDCNELNTYPHQEDKPGIVGSK